MKRLLALVAAAALTVLLVAVVNGGADPGSSPGKTIHVVERATTDAVTDLGPAGDSVGDLLTFANEIYDGANVHKVGTDQGYCVRTEVGKSSTALMRAPWSGTEISCRKPLPHSGQVKVAQVSRVVLDAASKQDGANRLEFVGSGESGPRPNRRRRLRGRRAELERFRLGDHDLTLSRVPLLPLIAVRDDIVPQVVRESCVVGAELLMGRDRAARITVAELAGAERSVHDGSVTGRLGSKGALRVRGSIESSKNVNGRRTLTYFHRGAVR
jgi:hypothetical protein